MKKIFQISLGQMILVISSFLVFTFLDFYLGAKLGPHFFWGIDLGDSKNSFLPEKLTEEQLAALLEDEGEVAITFHQELENVTDTELNPEILQPPPVPAVPIPVAKLDAPNPPVPPKKIMVKMAVKAVPKPEPLAELKLPPPGRYTLKVGSFSSYKEAQVLASRFQSKGFSARVETVQIPDKGNWYRVHVGRYPTNAEAASQKAQIERTFGIMPVIVSL
ncbi:MAG: SPOR domain-containing protein [Deltaproteobacteria bacterium]|nr:SPOR domain-containing protein [Deltaproteobacteria bacterium]